MKPNKALRELMAKRAGAAEKYAALPDDVQYVVNTWAALSPQERAKTMLEIASKPARRLRSYGLN